MFTKKNKLIQEDYQLFTIFDSKTGSYEIPSFAINQHDLIRQIINMFKDPAQKNNRFLTNAEDYSIYKIGAFCKHTGSLLSQELEHIANMHDLRATAQHNIHAVSTAQEQMGIVPT